MSKTNTIPPVAFFIFNRPEYTRKVFEQIRLARPKQLFVVADGPRNPAEKARCEETRAIIRVDWDCELRTNYAPENLGLKRRIPSGLDWFFEHVESGIILEDDCLPHQSFFAFAGEMLERYRNESRIMMISGDNFLPDFPVGDSYFYSRFFSIWGWATWRRAWKQYDSAMTAWPKKLSKQKVADAYPEEYMHAHVKKMFDRSHAGTLNSWDPQWLYACLMNDSSLCIVPKVNLVSNIGLLGTHSEGNNQNLPTYDVYLDGQLKHPSALEQNTAYDHVFYEKNFRPLALSLPQKTVATLKTLAVQSKSIKFAYRTAIAYKNKTSNRLFGVVSVPAKTRKRGNVLLSYLTGPFTLAPWRRFTDPHTNYWECSEIARLFSVRGYDVDVINASNTSFVPRKQYAAVVDVRQNLERWCTAGPAGTSLLPASCKKVMHITSSDSGFQNAAEAARLAKLKQRRGITLPARRIEAGAENPAYADFLEGFGNETVHATFARFNKPIRHIPISVAQTFESSEIGEASGKDFAEARKHFLFFSGGGAILKGLDLVVEAFAAMPELHLHIIGPAAAETEFRTAYAAELALPNISCYPRPRLDKTGTMTVGDTTFIAIANTCATLICPSASEGTSGAVIQAMHAGVFPIVTKQTGLAEDAPAIILENPTIESIRAQAKKIAQMSPEQLSTLAHNAWMYAREHHTKEHFSFAYGQFIDDMLRPATKPLISVIIPAHNNAETIKTAIDSILRQTYTNLEVIVVDDNSTDNTQKIVASIAKEDPRVAYYRLLNDDTERIDPILKRNTNAGYAARNFGFAKALGELITFQDGDDASLLNRLEIQYDLLTKHGAVHITTECVPFREELVGTEAEYKIDTKILRPEEIYTLSQKAKGIVAKISTRLNTAIHFHYKRLRVVNKLFFGNLTPYPGAGNSPMFKREVMEKVQFRKLKNRIWPSFMGRGADRDFNFQVAETFKNSFCFPIALYLWRK